jgi:nitrate reductase (NAD(P)H)
MMPGYHIGTLDKASQEILAKGEALVPEDAAPRDVFLQPKVWTKGILSAKKTVSADTKIFTFDLEHPAQTVGLPTGQHLMMRLRDPVTREAIIRSYTPISERDERGKLDVLVKVYYDTPERKGGKMTQALDAIPVGHFVDFKGPTGKFEYLGRGICSISGAQRNVKRFIMVSGGSGITPIFQVLRAVMKDADDPTQCLVLNGNRIEQDILCRQELDQMLVGNENKYRLLNTLSKPAATWTSLRGRIDEGFLQREVGACKNTNGEDMVLICGPEAMEKSVQSILKDMGWKDQDILFF